MNRGARFWILLAAFQVVFGLLIFAFTRQYYLHGPESMRAGPVTTSPHPLEWPDRGMESDLQSFLSSPAGGSALTDPAAMVNLGDEYFANNQYEQAADMYQQALDAGSENANTYNSLGITLYYLARSDEALRVIDEGIAKDPTYQRIWLTSGYVNSQLGNFEQAREALTKAVQLGADTDVGQSAAEMLDMLP
jgi:tetratricopeptide (TPR) repeat protein